MSMSGVNVSYDWFDDECNIRARRILSGGDSEVELDALVNFLKIEGRPANKALLDAVKVSERWARKIQEFPELKV